MRPLLALFVAIPFAALAFACGDAAPDAPPAGATGDDGGAKTPIADAGPSVDATTPTPPHDASPGADAPGDTAPPDVQVDAGPPPKQSLIWIWMDYASALGQVTDHADSFTHVSPALYQLNYDYASGPAKLLNENDDFGGISSSEIATRSHAAGLKCVPLMYAGAGNFGTDQGIQNVLNDAPAGAQSSFITSMVAEGLAKGYDGFNLDWEVQGTDDSYSDKLVAFLKAFKSAMNAKGMTVSLDVAGWYTKQCTGSNGTGMVDLTTLGADVVNQTIVEGYSGAFDDGATSCPASPPSGPGSVDCDSDFGGALKAMCNVPSSVVSIGLISTGSNGFADHALQAVGSYGFRNVAVWPDDAVFLNGNGIPNGATWYSLLADYLKN